MIEKFYKIYFDVEHGWWMFSTTLEWWIWLLQDGDYYQSRTHRFYERLNGS